MIFTLWNAVKKQHAKGVFHKVNIQEIQKKINFTDKFLITNKNG